MIIIDAKLETTAQVNDMLRLDCSRTSGADTVEVDLGEGFVEIDQFLDLAFKTPGEKAVQVRATQGVDTETATKTVTVLTEEQDRLFSSDEDLLVHEESIHDLLRPGKNTFKSIHRLAQQEIIRELNEKYPKLETKLTKDSLVEISQVRAWSKYLTLYYIFESNVNSTEDIHQQKAETYLNLAKVARDNVPIEVDFDGDGSGDEIVNLRSIGLTL